MEWNQFQYLRVTELSKLVWVGLSGVPIALGDVRWRMGRFGLNGK